MRQNRAWLRFRSRGGAARLLTAAGISVGFLLAAGCSSAGSPGPSGSSPGTPHTSAVPGPSSFPLTSAAPAPTAQPSAIAAASQSAAAAAQACAAFADSTFIYVRTVTTAPNGSLTLSANPASVVCGGPDDLHYDVSGTTVTCFVAPTAAISIFDMATMRSQPIAASTLGAYLATDQGTRIFLVTGVLTAIDGLVEQYHP